jgi:hypothetical protein
MRHMSEPLTPSARFLHDAGTLALLALVLIPLYLLLNHYWQSLILLVIFYGLLCSFCTRLGNYTRRVMRRLPAEIPPWHTLLTVVPSPQDWRDILVRLTRSRVCARTRTMCRKY